MASNPACCRSGAVGRAHHRVVVRNGAEHALDGLLQDAGDLVAHERGLRERRKQQRERPSVPRLLNQTTLFGRAQQRGPAPRRRSSTCSYSISSALGWDDILGGCSGPRWAAPAGSAGRGAKTSQGPARLLLLSFPAGPLVGYYSAAGPLEPGGA